MLPQDVSRLVDICRHSIYFDTIEGVTKCLNQIHSDKDVTILRIKNRFDPAFDAGRSAGYRNLSLNLRVVTKETLALGAETHICEVQLLLVQIATIKVSFPCHFQLFLVLIACSVFESSRNENRGYLFC